MFLVGRRTVTQVHVVMEEGLKGDEGTMAAILARTRAVVFIGERGALKIVYVHKGSGKPVQKKYQKSYFRLY